MDPSTVDYAVAFLLIENDELLFLAAKIKTFPKNNAYFQCLRSDLHHFFHHNLLMASELFFHAHERARMFHCVTMVK